MFFCYIPPRQGAKYDFYQRQWGRESQQRDLGDLEALTLGSYLHGGRKILEGESFGPCGTQVETVLEGIKNSGRQKQECNLALFTVVNISIISAKLWQ